MTYRVLVTGSRDWRDHDVVRDALTHARYEAPQGPMVVVHGACPGGADAIAAWWAASLGRNPGLAITAEAHPADWATWGRTAGFRRNAEMVEAGANLCLAFVNACTIPACHRRPQPHGSHGATHCARLAEGLGIPTTWHTPWATTPLNEPDQPDLFTEET